MPRKSCRSILIAGAIVALCAVSARAQEGAKIYSITNPGDSPLVINSLWVADTDNFTVVPLEHIPATVPPGGAIDFEVRLKPTDASEHSTQVWYRSSQGITALAVTMVAPFATNDVEPSQQPPHNKPIYPNPAKDFCTMDVDIRLIPDVQVDVFNELGTRVVGIIQSSGDKTILDTRTLSSGRYRVVISSGNSVVKNEEVVVRK